MLAVSSEELIEALRRGGFHLRPGTTSVLERDGREVIVPTATVLEAETLLSLLRMAGVPYLRLLELLSEDVDDYVLPPTGTRRVAK